jgi:response regulator RpfG family c-di-GMP phosphodiesterase
MGYPKGLRGEEIPFITSGRDVEICRKKYLKERRKLVASCLNM